MKYPQGRNAPINYLGEGDNVDSDFEDYTTGVDDGLKDQKEKENRAVLIAGSFSAYACFLVLLTREK